MWSTTDFRKGLKLEIDGEPFVIVDFQHVKPGKGGAFVRTRIKSMTSGRVLDKTYRSGDKGDKADMETCDAQFLYMEGETWIFMNTESYEQIPMSADQLGDATKYLKDSMVVELTQVCPAYSSDRLLPLRQCFPCKTGTSYSSRM